MEVKEGEAAEEVGGDRRQIHLRGGAKDDDTFTISILTFYCALACGAFIMKKGRG